MATLLIKPEEVRWGDEHVIGDSFNIQVYISDVENCYGVQFEIRWNSNILELVQLERGNFLEEEGVTTDWLQSYGEGYALCAYVRFQASSGVNIPRETLGLVASLTFRARSKGTSSIDFVAESCIWIDSFEIHSFDKLVGSVFRFGVYPLVKIDDLRYPEKAKHNDVVEVEIDWRNLGEDGVVWSRIIDLDTSEELGRKQWNVKRGEVGTVLFSLSMPNRSLNLRIETGHIE